MIGDLPGQVGREQQGGDRARHPRPRPRQLAPVPGEQEAGDEPEAEPHHADLVEQPESHDKAEHQPVAGPLVPLYILPLSTTLLTKTGVS